VTNVTKHRSERLREASEAIRLRRALERFHIDCNNLSHRKGEFHKHNEPCPVEALVRAALDGE
jgi:hypothetical protein